MAADYTNTPRWSKGSTGSVLVPELWMPELEPELPMYNFWGQFVGETWGNQNIVGPGAGEIFHVTYVTDKAAKSTPLSEGTEIQIDTSTGVGQASGTIYPYGDAEAIDNFTAWLSNSDLQKASGLALARGAMITRNAVIGAMFTGGLNRFTCDDATTCTEFNGTHAEGTDGTYPILPYHVRSMVSTLRRKGIAPFPDGFYRCIGAPGSFDSLKGSSEHYDSAAELGIPGLFTTGLVQTYNGVVFIEEFGANRVSTYNGTASSSTIFGMNAVVGGDNFLRPDLITYYPDDKNDFGRRTKIGWYALGGYVRPCDGSTNARSWRIFHGV